MFHVLAIIVVLYYIIVRYSCLSGSHAEDTSTEETTEGCFSSLSMSLNTNLLLNYENISAKKISNEEPMVGGAADLLIAALLEINSFPGVFQAISKFFRNVFLRKVC